eukprot:s501_g22.t1
MGSIRLRLPLPADTAQPDSEHPGVPGGPTLGEFPTADIVHNQITTRSFGTNYFEVCQRVGSSVVRWTLTPPDMQVLRYKATHVTTSPLAQPRGKKSAAAEVLAAFEGCLRDHAAVLERRLCEMCELREASDPCGFKEISPCPQLVLTDLDSDAEESDCAGRGGAAVAEEIEDEEPRFVNYWEDDQVSAEVAKPPTSVVSCHLAPAAPFPAPCSVHRSTEMPHVFNYDEGKFEQVHYNKVAQRSSQQIGKRQRTTETMKFLLQQEASQIKKEEARAKRNAED